MSIKKRFSIAPELATGIRNSIQSASSNQGQLHYDMMSLDGIEPDPNNPRKLLLSRHEILNGLDSNDPEYTVKIKEMDALLELSESIKKIGVRNAIEVYKNGLRYRIITGERRYWATLLSGQKTIPVRISQKPDEFNLRYTQWVENINRKDLSLWEKFNNLSSMVNAYKNTNQGEFSEQILQTLLGISNIQAYRYFCLLKADDKVVQLIQLGRLNNLKVIQELVSMKDKGARNQMISWILSSKEEITTLAHYRQIAGKKSSKSKQSINLGKINNIQTIKKLIELALSDTQLEKHQPHFRNIDWTSNTATTKAFKTLLKAIEKEFPIQEMV